MAAGLRIQTREILGNAAVSGLICGTASFISTASPAHTALSALYGACRGEIGSIHEGNRPFQAFMLSTLTCLHFLPKSYAYAAGVLASAGVDLRTTAFVVESVMAGYLLSQVVPTNLPLQEMLS